jgi:membrane-associated phospholipid phosphatase
MAVIAGLALMYLPGPDVVRALVMGFANWIDVAVLAFGLKKLTNSRWPSAHTASAATLVLSALFAVPPEWMPVWGIGGIIGWFAIFFTGWGRVVLGRHNWTEVVAGAVLGMFIALVGAWVFGYIR